MAAITVNEVKAGQGGVITWTNSSGSDTLLIAAGSETGLLVSNSGGATVNITIAPVTTTIPTNGQFPEITVGNMRDKTAGTAPILVAAGTTQFIPSPPTCYIASGNTMTVVSSVTGSSVKYAGIRKV